MHCGGVKRSERESRGKYQLVDRDDIPKEKTTDKTSLLTSMEHLDQVDENTSCDPIRSAREKQDANLCTSDGATKPDNKTCSNSNILTKEDVNTMTKPEEKAIEKVQLENLKLGGEASDEERDTFIENGNIVMNSKDEKQGAIPKQRVKKTHSEQVLSTHDDKPKLDIVRKMSEICSSNYVPWQLVGSYFTLKQKVCHRLYAKTGRSDDLALFFHNGRFYAMEAWCTHMGGPLFEGDIEDYNGRCHVMCPWHSYMFDLDTGKNEIGLQQKVYDMKYENAKIYVRYHTSLTLDAQNRKISEVRQLEAQVINFPPKGGKLETVQERKTSVLESPLRL